MSNQPIQIGVIGTGGMGGRFDVAYTNEIQSWVAGVATGKLEGPTAWGGYTSLVVADACLRSFETGQPETVPLADRPSFYSER